MTTAAADLWKIGIQSKVTDIIIPCISIQATHTVLWLEWVCRYTYCWAVLYMLNYCTVFSTFDVEWVLVVPGWVLTYHCLPIQLMKPVGVDEGIVCENVDEGTNGAYIYISNHNYIHVLLHNRWYVWNRLKLIGIYATFVHIQAKLSQEYLLMRMVRWVRWHYPP